MKRRRIAISTFIVVLLFVAFIVAANDSMISIRIHELKELLQEMDSREGSIDNISLVTTYEIHKKLFENSITQDRADAVEFTVSSLSNINADRGKNFSSMNSLFFPPVLAIINLNRRILGKMPLALRNSDDTLSVSTDLAYYHERNFHFKRAIELYDKSLAEKKLSDSIRAGILLHQGYCYALSQKEDEARRNYMTVIEQYGRENSAITATVLLRYLEGFSLARKRVLSGGDDSLSRSRQLVSLMDYRRALEILETVEREARPGDLSRITYFKARCFAGMGEPEKAVDNYLKIILSDPSSEYARWSNRRIFMIGSRSGEKELVKMSSDLNKKLNDTELNRMISESRAADDGGTIKQDMIKISISPEVRERIDKITAQKGKPVEKAGRYLVIITSDGNTFKGTVVRETGEHISLQTSIGTINVKKDRITKISDK